MPEGSTAQQSEFGWTIRPAQPSDHRFLVETIAKVRQPREMSWLRWSLLGVPMAQQTVLSGASHVAEADGVILGFVTEQAGAVEMLYVKRDFRGNGIGLDLLAKAADPTETVTARAPTSSWRAWCRRRGIEWRAAR